MRRAKGSAFDREPFGSFLGLSTGSGDGAEWGGEGGLEGSDMVEGNGEEESSGRECRIADGGNEVEESNPHSKVWLGPGVKVDNVYLTPNTCDNNKDQ